MNFFSPVVVCLSLLICGSLTAAEALKSGPQVGEHVGAFHVIKSAGNPTDGVEVGKDLCYRCKMGNRPVVMVFTRNTDAKLGQLMQEVDKLVASDAARDLPGTKKLVSFVNLLGTDSEKGRPVAEKFVTDNKLNQIAVVVPNDQPNGPGDFKLAADAEVTVVIYKQGTVMANYALPAGGLSDEIVKKVVTDAKAALN